MKISLSALWPRPESISSSDLEAIRQEGLDLDGRIKRLKDLNRIEPSVHLEAAQRIAAEEDRRRLGAETRATTFIAAVATLFPLMTWALGNTNSSICSPGLGCFVWTGAFVLAVVYFITAAHCALNSLAVANYHVIGVEDIVQIREERKDILRELTQQTLLQARRNRDTINLKLTYIKVAQLRFFNGLAILGLLLMFDPMVRLGVIDFVQSKTKSWVTSIASELSPVSPTVKPAPSTPAQSSGR